MKALSCLIRTTLLLLCLRSVACGAPITEERCAKYQGLKNAVPIAKLQAEFGAPTAIVRSDAEAAAASEKYRTMIAKFFPDDYLLYVTPTQVFVFLKDRDGKCQYGGSTRVFSQAEYDQMKADAAQNKAARDEHPWALRCSGVSVSNGVASVTVDGKTDPYLSKIAQYFHDRDEKNVRTKPTDAELLKLFGAAPSQILVPNGRYTGPVGQLQDYLKGAWSMDKALKVQVYRHPKKPGILYVLLVSSTSVWGGGIGAPPGY